MIGRSMVQYIPFPMVFALCEMQTASLRIRTLITVSIFYVDYHYTKSNVFANGPGDLGFNPRSTVTKNQKWYLILSCLTLSIIRNGSRVSGPI